MAYTRTYSTIVPLEPGTDRELALWLARESFERKAEGDALVLVEFEHRDVDPDDLPPKAEKQLGRPLTDFEFVEYTGVGRRAEAV
ncbi:minor tail protein [Mycobacterium phage BoostSeason]|uniref:Minor tail protein n=1 Tax=Mycobacterium phage Mufasa TaxID=1718600 RepID=A0A0M4QU75_9CAUD|nr:minor tail protein [Mycobacterium phage Mufasa]ALF00456.1 minor tail protein [Mycobacterium phage Mufasa]AYN57195.1 minor tail protein [Mycobacterium phage BoostSeason]